MDLVLVLNLGDVFPKRIIEFCESWAKVRVVSLVKGVDPGVQAKISRMWVAGSEEFKNAHITICDLDMVQIDDVRAKTISRYLGENLIQWGYDHPSYSVEPDIGKWPMDGTTSLGNTFKSLVNPNEKNLAECFLDWSACATFDKRSNPFNRFDMFSDESLLRDLLTHAQHPPKIQRIPRMSVESRMLRSRIDRATRAPTLLNRRLKKQIIHEFHGPRPFLPETRIGRLVLERLGVDPREYQAFISELNHFLD